MRTHLVVRFHGGTLGLLTILGALLGGSPLAADLYGIRSQELRDGIGEELEGTPSFGDGLGGTVVVGDFDGDDKDDVATFDFEDAPGLPGAGAVHVAYGSFSGLSVAGDQLWYDFDPELLLIERQASAYFGYALAVGDFDGNGCDDLAVGVPFRDIGAVSDAGSVLVIYGTFDGLQNVDPPAKRFRLGSGGVLGGPPQVGDNMGRALAAGDFDGSGIDDLAIGVPGKPVGALAGAGRVLVLYGLATGLSITHQQIFDQNSFDGGGSMGDTAETNDRFGNSLAAGDFNGDGEDDLAIGVPFEDFASLPGIEHGAVNVVYGSTSVGLHLLGTQFWTQNNIDTGDVIESGDSFGMVLAAGDLTGDGNDELVIGTPREDFEGVVNIADSGEITVLYGQPVSGLSTLLSQSYVEEDFAVGGAMQAFDHFGAALAIGRLQHSIVDTLDLAIGTPDDNVWNGFSDVDGAGSVIVTRQNGVFLGSPGDRRWAQGYGGSAGLLAPNQGYGSALAAGDFDFDGFGDFAIGAPGFDSASNNGVGALYILYGSLFSDGFESHDTSAWTLAVP